jgi:hypothetical protein
MTELRHTRLQELLQYSTDTGLFQWKTDRHTGRGRGRKIAAAGDLAGSKTWNGYWCIRLDGRCYMAHRLAWFYVNGEWPSTSIDHVDMDRTNNRLVNLRLASNGENLRNRSLQRNNTSGHKGVTFDVGRGKWLAQISIDRRHIQLGRFDSIDGAVCAYRSAAVKYHGEFARL